MSTVERLEILKGYLDKETIDYESYYVEDKHKEEGKNLLETKETVINTLLKRVSDLEFEVEKLEKNEQYKYINGQAYFRQDYVLGREKEIDRLNNIINKAYNETKKQNDEADYQEETDLSIILDILKGSDKE